MEAPAGTIAAAGGAGPALGIAEVLALHPWPAAHAGLRRIERLIVLDLPATPDELWPHLADSSRLNRTLGMSEMHFEERGGERWGRAVNGGVRHEWQELPWSWVAGQWLTCTRVYTRGFSRVMYAVHRLEPTASGTRIYLYFGAVPRGPLGALALRIGMGGLAKAYGRVLPALAAQLGKTRPKVLELAPPELAPAADARLREARERLVGRGLRADVVDALLGWIRAGDELDLHRIQVRERARVWRLPEDELLRVALHATRDGLLALSWDTVCPHCRGPREHFGELQALTPASSCGTCEVEFSTGLEEAIEVTFRVHPGIREVAERLYCSAEPAMRSHIKVTHELPPGARARLRPRLPSGRYRLRVGQTPGFLLDVDEHNAPAALRWPEAPPAQPVAAGPGLELELDNPGPAPRTFVVERAAWSDDALRPSYLLSFPDFRDLFAEDYLGAGVQLSVGQQTLLFTDVVGSTRFYAERGDPAAFVEIKRHFDEVFAIVRANRGAVIKTIGDAVMAAFVTPLDAVRAAAGIHAAFGPDRADTPIRLRISLNTGPCIAVRLSSNIDYFGGTVNVAAKLQSLAEAYQVAIAETTYAAPGVAAYVAERGGVLDEVRYASGSLPEPIPARRWTVAAADPG